MIEYEEIMMKYVEGKLFKMYDWILTNLETDPEVVAGNNPDKELLRKFLQQQHDELEDFIQDGGIDDRDMQDDSDIFGDEDIVTSPDSSLDERSDDFMTPPDDDDDEGEEWKNDSA
jgi:hypothetical protein